MRIWACFDGGFLRFARTDAGASFRLPRVSVGATPSTIGQGYQPIASALAAGFASLGSPTVVDIDDAGIVTLTVSGSSPWGVTESAPSDVRASFEFLGIELPIYLLLGSGTIVGTRPVKGILWPKFPYKTGGSTDHYEPDGMWSEAEADDGSSYAIGRLTAPIYEDFRIGFESLERTFDRHQTADVPMTFQSFLRLIGAGHPFVLEDDRFVTTHKMRAGAARFRPIREVSEYDGYWHWPFETRVLGWISAVVPPPEGDFIADRDGDYLIDRDGDRLIAR